MLARCPNSSLHALAVLRGWRWIIGERGFANVVVSRGKEGEGEREGGEFWVEGILNVLGGSGEGEGDEEKLDRFEGVPWAYQKVERTYAIFSLSSQSEG